MSEWRWFRAKRDSRRHALVRDEPGLTVAACGAQRTRGTWLETTGPKCLRCERITNELDPDAPKPILRWVYTARSRWHMVTDEKPPMSLCGLPVVPRPPEVPLAPLFQCGSCQRVEKSLLEEGAA